MKISTKGRYGLRIMLELAARHGTGPVLVTTIARNQDLPAKYIHVLVGGLKAAGLVTAVRGPNGGLELAREPGRITPLDIVEAMEGRITAVDCAQQRETCERSGICVAREVWCDLAEAMEASLKQHTLAELVERAEARSGGGDAYSI